MIAAVKEVGGPSFFALLVIAVRFLPVFALEAQEGRLFKPLAFTKNFSMVIAAVLAITLDPAMRLLFTRMDDYNFRPKWLAKIVNAHPRGQDPQRRKPPDQPADDEDLSPCGRVRSRTQVADDRHGAVLVDGAHGACVFQARLGIHAATRRRHAALHATTLPGISVTEASRLLQTQDKIISSFPEVERVFGKAGRAESATDPAPVLDDGNRHRAQAAGRVAEARALVLEVGAQVATAVCCGASGRTTRPHRN